ncbi:MAG: dTDP-4-dehydrorhamnose reductase [Elusimicrobia bacterium]|nr:dTDP-4-dehydrorhamnose reductase [Elusimicrobiota bacterium]
MKYLVLGSQGQFAKEFIKALSAQGIQCLAPDEASLNITDINSVKAAIAAFSPNIIINCAAYTNVDAAETDEAIAYLVNADAPKQISELCADKNIKLVHFSTDYVFDGAKNDYYTETDAINPLNVYGKSKLAGEVAVLENPNALVFRLSWLTGYGSQNYLYKFSGWAKNNKILKVSADEVSVPTFTFDAASIVLKAVNANLKGLYHLTNGGGYASRYELSRLFAKLSGLNNIIVPVPMAQFNLKVARPLFSPMSNEKLCKDLNLQISAWQDSLKKYVTELNVP